ncbi:MAG: DUF3179 domain-containing (seleno)protein [Bacteroidota bacterium]
MNKIFFGSLVGLILFEILNVYFIMPMPGSQRMRSIDIAYFLYDFRWMFRIIFGIGIVLTFAAVFRFKKWLPILSILILIAVAYLFNFNMAADAMFLQPRQLQMLSAKANKITKDRMIIGVEHNGESKAYPISLIGYHHQVLDTVGGKPIMVTYCTVCRTGRVYEPMVNGKPEKFRLVGMDHFNAMFEDATTKSWWRQANGEAIKGKLKGQKLPELLSYQTSLEKWFEIHPNSLVMQADQNFTEKYDSTYKYERGKSMKELTRTDSLSWKDKSWVVGITIGKQSKAFDWLRLKRERIVNETINGQPIVLVLASDDKSFFAFQRHSASEKFAIKKDTLVVGTKRYNLKGTALNSVENESLKPVKAYQEFWHSWKSFHENTEKY